MNIAILSRGENLYSTQSLLKAGEARNHEMEILDPLHFTLAVKDGKTILYYFDDVVDDLDAVIPRISTSNTFYGSTLVRQFEAIGVFCTVTATGILNARDKWTSFQLLSKGGIAVPETILGSYQNAEGLLKDFKEKPVIIKLLEGTHGNGVILSETYQNALATIETLQSSNIKFLVQEYIAESKGADVRAIVINGRVVASMKRQCKTGDFRSNLHRGGSSNKIKLTTAEEQMAVKAAKVLGLGVCGVDILQATRGPLVLEVNSTPGLEGIETTTGINISEKIITYLERNKR